MSDGVKELWGNISVYANYVHELNGDWETSELIYLLHIRDLIEEGLAKTTLPIAMAARLRLLRLDSRLAANRRYLVDVVRGQGEAFHKPASYWWWYLDAVPEARVVQEMVRRPAKPGPSIPVPAPTA